jgi:fumarate reductase flavoprotein subunit
LVVVGAGISGVCVAIAAAENGVKVTVLEKGPAVTGRGIENAAFNSEFQLRKGVKMNREELAAALLQASGYRADQVLINLWLDKSGPALDWLTKIAVAGGRGLS